MTKLASTAGTSPWYVVQRPPASSTISCTGAKSQSFMIVSQATSSAPSATRQCCQKSPSPRFDQARRTISPHPSGMRRADVVETAQSSSRETAETRHGSPFTNAPSPRIAHQRRPSAGAETRLSTTSAERTTSLRLASVAASAASVVSGLTDAVTCSHRAESNEVSLLSLTWSSIAREVLAQLNDRRVAATAGLSVTQAFRRRLFR